MVRALKIELIPTTYVIVHKCNFIATYRLETFLIALKVLCKN